MYDYIVVGAGSAGCVLSRAAERESGRVADASIMPTIVGGHTHAAAVMIGEKAADMVAADARA